MAGASAPAVPFLGHVLLRELDVQSNHESSLSALLWRGGFALALLLIQRPSPSKAAHCRRAIAAESPACHVARGVRPLRRGSPPLEKIYPPSLRPRSQKTHRPSRPELRHDPQRPLRFSGFPRCPKS